MCLHLLIRSQGGAGSAVTCLISGFRPCENPLSGSRPGFCFDLIGGSGTQQKSSGLRCHVCHSRRCRRLKAVICECTKKPPSYNNQPRVKRRSRKNRKRGKESSTLCVVHSFPLPLTQHEVDSRPPRTHTHMRTHTHINIQPWLCLWTGRGLLKGHSCITLHCWALLHRWEYAF